MGIHDSDESMSSRIHKGNSYEPPPVQAYKETSSFYGEPPYSGDKFLKSPKDVPSGASLIGILDENNTQPREIPIPHDARFIRITIHHNSVKSLEDTIAKLPASLIHDVLTGAAAKGTRVIFSVAEFFVVDDLDIPFVLKHPREGHRRLVLTGAVDFRDNSLSKDESLGGAAVWSISISPRPSYPILVDTLGS